MRKIIVLTFISLDGVMQAPGGPEEDISGGFEFGGWMAPYSDEVLNEVLKKEMEPSDLLLGRTTFDIWANYWPQHEKSWPGINDVVKYVVSEYLKVSDWKNTVFLRSIAEVEKLKNSDGSNIQVWGSSRLVQALLENDLVDELSLKIFPITLGKGKRLFDNGPIPAAFQLIDSNVTSNGVIMARYRRAGDVRTGNAGD